MNLRGVKESGKAFAVPTYGFVLGVLGMVAYGLFRTATGDAPVAESAAYDDARAPAQVLRRDLVVAFEAYGAGVGTKGSRFPRGRPDRAGPLR